MVKNNKGSRKGPSTAKIAAKQNAMTTKLEGRKVVPAADPPDFVQLPWNNWTYEATFDTTQEGKAVMKINTILDQIALRCGIASKETIRVKILKARGWVTAGAGGEGFGVPDLSTQYFELAGQQPANIEHQYPRSVQRDKGTLSRPAKTGWDLPISDTKEIFGAAEGVVKIASFQCPISAATVMTIRFQLLWQSGIALNWMDEPIVLAKEHAE